MADDRYKLVERLAAAYEADIYFYSGMIDDVGYGKLAKAMGSEKNRNKALFDSYH